MTRIAFAVASDNGLESPIADRFGRAPYFLIVDYTREGGARVVKTIQNPGAQAHGGAAVKAVEALLREGVELIVGPNFGPNARVIMSELGITGRTASPGKKVRDVLEELGFEEKES